MTRETKLRLLGGCVLLSNLALIGHYDLQGLSVVFMTFGFAVGYEFLIVRRMGFSPRETAAATDDHFLYERAASEIQDRRAIKAVWAKAFAEADGDQKRTTARYIALRVEQIKLEQQAEADEAKNLNTPRPRWWSWVLQSFVIFLLVKLLIGLLPAGMAAACYIWLVRRRGAALAIAGSAVFGLSTAFAVSYLLPLDEKLKAEIYTQQSSEVQRPSFDKDPAAWQERVNGIRDATERGEIPVSQLLAAGSHKDLTLGSYHAALLSEKAQTWWKTESEFFIYFHNPASQAVRALEFSYNYGECSADMKGETYIAELERPVSTNEASLIVFPSIDKEHRRGCLTVLRIYH